MRTEYEIKNRFEAYKQNLKKIKSEQGQKLIKYAMAELDWVLGGEGK
jgi:hypothetical protein